jgi:hypothetical protein
MYTLFLFNRSTGLTGKSSFGRIQTLYHDVVNNKTIVTGEIYSLLRLSNEVFTDVLKEE